MVLIRCLLLLPASATTPPFIHELRYPPPLRPLHLFMSKTHGTNTVLTTVSVLGVVIEFMSRKQTVLINVFQD